MVDKYDDLADTLRTLGVKSEAEIAEYLAQQRAEDEALDARRCPACGRPLDRKVDSRLDGVGRADDQVWINYRCKCGFMMDRAE